jgi:signal transduction histidine kinase
MNAETRSPDAPLLHRVRLRLILWSGGSTLVLLAVLGGLLYWATAARLRSESVDQLAARAANLQISTALSIPADATSSIRITGDPSGFGMIVGGPFSGTIATVAIPGSASGSSGGGMTEISPTVTGAVGASAAGTTAAGTTATGVIDLPVPNDAAVAAALAGQTTVEERDTGGLPVRVLTTGIGTDGQRVVVQVLADRSAEVRTMQTLLLVLVIGGLLVVLAAAGLGYLYAGRALIPIRTSLARQREFAADASHELRTPLAVMTASIEHLKRHHDDPAATARAIADLETGTGRLAGLVDDLLTLARADAEAIEVPRVPVDLAEAAAEALASFEAQAAGAGVRLRLDIEPAAVAGDPARLRQLVGVLVDNAIRHSPAGGTVAVRVRPGAALEVTDDGPGIRDEDLPNVFRRFWRASDAPAGGTGLGLAIADWIVRSHGGRIHAVNRPEGGACFSVSLPGQPAGVAS